MSLVNINNNFLYIVYGRYNTVKNLNVLKWIGQVTVTQIFYTFLNLTIIHL